MTYDEQLTEWVKGISIHNNITGECCPDFSCCQPDLACSIEQRITFRDHPESRMEILGMFLGAAIAKMTNKKIYITGEADKTTH